MVAQVCAAKKQATRLKDENGTWVTDAQELRNLVATHFQHFFLSQRTQAIPLPPDLDRWTQTADFSGLDSLVTMEELRLALFHCNSFKSLGSNGVHAHFFKKGWCIVNYQLLDFVNQICLNPQLISSINQTFLYLIPKKDHIEAIGDF